MFHVGVDNLHETKVFGQVKHQGHSSGFREGRVREVRIAFCNLFFRGFIYLNKSYFPPVISFKTNLWVLLFRRHGKMSEGQSVLIQIFLFNLGLLVAMGTWRYSADLKKDEWLLYCHVLNSSVLRHFKIKIYGPFNCFLLYTFVKEGCLMCTLRVAQGCGLQPVICVLSGGRSGNISPLPPIRRITEC